MILKFGIIGYGRIAERLAEHISNLGHRGTIATNGFKRLQKAENRGDY